MTRKEALKQAITILSADSANEETCIILQELYNEYPMTQWSNEAILDAFNQYILDHGRLPSMGAIRKTPSLPNHTVVKSHFGMEMKEFYSTYYPDYANRCQSRVYYQYTTEDLFCKFKTFYVKNGCRSMEAYDKSRPAGYPCARHLIRLSGCDTWNEFLDFCGIPLQGQSKFSRVRPSLSNPPLTIQAVHPDISREKADEIFNLIANSHH